MREISFSELVIDTEFSSWTRTVLVYDDKQKPSIFESFLNTVTYKNNSIINLLSLQNHRLEYF